MASMETLDMQAVPQANHCNVCSLLRLHTRSCVCLKPAAAPAGCANTVCLRVAGGCGCCCSPEIACRHPLTASSLAKDTRSITSICVCSTGMGYRPLSNTGRQGLVWAVSEQLQGCLNTGSFLHPP